MVTSNGDESRIRGTRSNGTNKDSVRHSQNGEKRENRGYDRSNKDERKSYSRDSRGSVNGSRTRNGDSEDRGYRRNNLDNKGGYRSNNYKGNRTEQDSRDGNSRKEYSQDGRQGNRSSYNRNSDSRAGGFRSNGTRDHGKPYKKNFGGNYTPYDKDRDEDLKPGQRSSRQSQNKETKVKEQQPDKSQIINRIEKEKKAVQKKQADRKNNKSARQVLKPKRTNNIDWTNVYENGEYDDDDMDMFF